MSDFTFKDATVKKMKLDDLKPAEYNPRKIRDEAFDALGKSIDRFGMLIPIVWNKKSGNIVGGHQRFKHLVEMGDKETDVVVVDLDNNDEVALNIALNSHEIRGDFTSQVVDLLKRVEVNVGAAFNELGLHDLFEDVKRMAPKEEKPPWKPEDHQNPQGQDRPKGNDAPVVQGPEAILTCPKCSSRWKMKDNEVVFNAVKEVRNGG